MLSAFSNRFAPGDTPGKHHPAATKPVSQARRGFFAKAAVGAVSISGTAGLAKVVVDTIPEPDLSDLYQKDLLAGEQELGEREYVLMSAAEKEDMVQQFIDNYREKG